MAGVDGQLDLARSEPGFLTSEECAAVRTAALAAGLSRSRVSKGGQHIVSRRRTSDEAHLPRTPDTEWLYDRLAKASAAVNQTLWRFDLSGIQDIHILRYRPFQRFRWHSDGARDSVRRLTCIVALSPRRSHWRGGLQVKAAHEGRELAAREGSITWFPSYLRHRATAPWWGERWVLVTWLTGAPQS